MPVVNPISVEGCVDSKTCTHCKTPKDPRHEFYMCQGKLRSECKACTIQKNARYQRRVKPWKNRSVDLAKNRAYMGEYYRNNREKFAQYRQTFKEKYPDYYRDYFQKRKNPQMGGK